MSNASPTAPKGHIGRAPVILAIIAALIGLGLEFTVLRGYGGHWWNAIPAFYLMWGGLAALVLLGASRLASVLLIEQEESHG